MKKSAIILGAATLILFSCKKNESGNKSVIKDENVSVTNNNGVIDSASSSSTVIKDGNQEIQEHSYRYVAEDGRSAKVTFVNSDKANYITVLSNGKTIRAEQSEASAKNAVYKNQDVEIVSEGDNITITQGNNVIELRKAKGE